MSCRAGAGKRRAAMAAVVLLACICWVRIARAADSTAPPLPLREQMRMPWTPVGAPFIRHWLICGEFPNPDLAGLRMDYLADHGGERAIIPAPGMTEARPDGSTARWFSYHSPDDVVNLLKALAGRPTNNVVAYAYTEVDWPADEEVTLSLGSDDGARVWVNGFLVLDHYVPRSLTKDQDQAPVFLHAGKNQILVKIEQGGGDWGFCLRFLSSASLYLQPRPGISLNVPPADRARPNRFVAHLGSTVLAPGQKEIEAAVRIVAPGGRVVDYRRARAGSTVVFDATDWPPGAYDVRCSGELPDGRRSLSFALWYHGDALAAAKRLLAEAPYASTRTQPGIVTHMLADLVRDRLGGDLRNLDRGRLPTIYSALLEWQELKMDGGRGGVRSNGFIRLAYRDPVDGSPQFCRAYLPDGYVRGRRWPMIVNLHGYNPGNPPYINWGIDGRHNGLADFYGVIDIEPMGRYNTTFEGIGEKDVVRCVEMAEKQLSVDKSRVYLVGGSMGGGGVWYVGARHPELFAAISPSFGGRDYHADITDAQNALLTPNDRYRAERRSMFVQAEALLTTPVLVNHGDQDDLVKVDYSRYVMAMMQRWGYDVRYWEHPGKGHGGLDSDDDMLHWLLPIRRVSDPRRVRVRSADVSTAAAHWVRVEQCLNPWRLMHVDAEVLGDNVIRLDTDNVARVTLSPGKALIARGRPVRVVWNARDVRTVDFHHGSVTLDVAGYTAPPGGKTPALAGRLDDVFRTPYAIIVGTLSTNPTMLRYIQRSADQLVTEWKQDQHVTPRLYRDVALPASAARRYSLVLIGGPAENSVARALCRAAPPRANRDHGPSQSAGPWPFVPLEVRPDGFLIDGHFFPTTDSALSLVYKSPLNPERYVAVVAATSPAGMFYADDLPGDVDFGVVDGRVPEDRDSQVAIFNHDTHVRVLSGMFDNGWRVNDAFLDPGDPAMRAQRMPRKVPIWMTTAVHTGSLSLSDVLETKSEGPFGLMMRDQSWQGGPITLAGQRYAHGIGAQVAAWPSTATYDLSGAGWAHLKATIGIEVDVQALDQKAKDNTLVQFEVDGNGHRLYRSPMLHWDSPPIDIDVDIRDVQTLKLSVSSGATFHNAARSVDWADIRLER